MLISKEDFAKYPFTIEAVNYVKSLDLKPDELSQPEFSTILTRAEARIEEALREGITKWKVHQEYETEILSYPVAIRLKAGIDNTAGVLYLFWVDLHIGGQVHYSLVPLAAAKDTRAWAPPVALPCVAEDADVAIDRTGIIHLVFGSSEDPMSPAVYYIRSEDAGMTWSDPVLVYSTATPVPAGMSGW